MSGQQTFWERRRAGLRAEALADEVSDAQAEAAQTKAQQAEMTEAELLASLDLPDPDSMGAGDDFTAFMAKAVPQHLRNRALRKLWRSNPVLACLDGLNDYDDDYLTGSTGQGVLKTTYQVGKGLMAHLNAVADAAAAQEEAPLPAPEQPVAETITIESAQTSQTVEDAQIDEPATETHMTSLAPRRMRFQFQTGAA